MHGNVMLNWIGSLSTHWHQLQISINERSRSMNVNEVVMLPDEKAHA